VKAQTKANPKSAKPKTRQLAAIVGAAAVAAILAGLIWFFFLHNYAQDVAKPLEDGLAKAGAIKKCGSGDPGRGPDNTQPHYSVYYELPFNREQAIGTINKVASDNGYNLSHASLTNKGPVPVADQYIDNWFYDTVGKPSPYKDLEPGKINLFFAVNNDGPIELSHLACGTDKPVKVSSDANTTAIRISVDLPPFKR
jgi:hypothetical protein